MLTEPTAELKHHSRRLSNNIQRQIARNHGWIGFDQFMDQALYASGLGYYRAGLDKFGKTGDFVTAPLMGDLFARCLAKQCVEVLTAIGYGGVVEFGAGDGQLAADMLLAMNTMGRLPDRYLILETSAELIGRQRETILRQCGELSNRVSWIGELPEDGFVGVVMANEVLDAMPVIRFEIDESGYALELGVASSANEFPNGEFPSEEFPGGEFPTSEYPDDSKFHWAKSADLLPDYLQSRLEVHGLARGYQGEIGLRAEAWVRSIGEKINTGVMLLIDYGFPQHEFYHMDRRSGTLMCHYRHVAHDDPFFYPGLQDISAHVDFTAIDRAAQGAQLELTGFTTQGTFLLSLGVLDMLLENQQNPKNNPQQSLEMSRQIKKLTMPHEMGELFKVIAFSRNYNHSLSGFSLKDHRSRLL